jgi:hypothetical protein
MINDNNEGGDQGGAGLWFGFLFGHDGGDRRDGAGWHR